MNKKALLPLFSALAISGLSASTSAQAAPSREETVAYILQQCEGTQLEDFAVVKVSISGKWLHYSGDDIIKPLSKREYFTLRRNKVDLSVVTIELAKGTTGHAYIKFSCNYNCVTITLDHVDEEGRHIQLDWLPYGDSPSTHTNLYCRQPERVVNALKHLQSLLPDDDPFASSQP